MKHKDIIIGVVIVIAVVVGMIFLIGSSAPSRPAAGTASSVPAAPPDGDWYQGNASATVTLVEYADFQCPACAAYYPVVKQLAQNMGGKVKFVYRYFPLFQIHRNANLSAAAAEAAGRQGKFWEMHDMLFEHQNDWAESGDALSIFTNYAQNLGLNLDQLKSDVQSSAVKDKISAEYQAGVSAGINATPTFFLNGKMIQNPRSYDAFRTLLENAVSGS